MKKIKKVIKFGKRKPNRRIHKPEIKRRQTVFKIKITKGKKIKKIIHKRSLNNKKHKKQIKRSKIKNNVNKYKKEIKKYKKEIKKYKKEIKHNKKEIKKIKKKKYIEFDYNSGKGKYVVEKIIATQKNGIKKIVYLTYTNKSEREEQLKRLTFNLRKHYNFSINKDIIMTYVSYKKHKYQNKPFVAYGYEDEIFTIK